MRALHVIAGAAAFVLLAGCAAHPDPIIDTKGEDPEVLAQDLEECEAYSHEVQISKGVGKGAATGAVIKKHAGTIVRAWARARQEIGLQPEYSGTLAIGAMLDLWEILLNQWLLAVRHQLPDTALQIESHSAEVLMRPLSGALISV